MKMDSEVNGNVDENPDNVLELAIDFAVRGRYPPGLSKVKKRMREDQDSIQALIVLLSTLVGKGTIFHEGTIHFRKRLK